MESVLRLIQHTAGEKAGEKTEQANIEKQILSELREVGRLMACNDLWFQLECDSDLIDACIYQRASLRAHYRYLLNAARREGVTSAPEVMKRLGV